ncbi:MAG: FMN-binding protein [FCB group bacterium]|jgi:electron transport complex protein RnfG|nr:FMN-binding protein [FCB group bacterium]
MSNTTPAARKADQPNSLHMIAVLGGFSFLSGFLIFFAVQATEAGIKQSRLEQLRGAVFQVLPGATSSQAFAVGNEGFRPVEIDDPTPGMKKVYAGYDDGGALVGVAIEAAAQGYQDVIRAIYGYNPESGRLIGFAVLQSSETPGLGDRIGKDPQFLANFFASDTSPDTLSLELTEDASGLAHAVEFAKNGEKSKPYQVEGISGATISSKAVVRMLNDSAQEAVPLIRAHLDQLQKGTS